MNKTKGYLLKKIIVIGTSSSAFLNHANEPFHLIWMFLQFHKKLLYIYINRKNLDNRNVIDNENKNVDNQKKNEKFAYQSHSEKKAKRSLWIKKKPHHLLCLSA